MDVWKNTTGSNGSIFHESSKLIIVSNGKLDMSWDDSGFFVVFGGITCELKNLSGKILKDGSSIDWGTSSDSVGISSFFQESGNSSDWELKTGSGGFGNESL